MVSVRNLALRGLQFLFMLIVLALVGNIIAEASNGNPAIINYDMFVAVFAMLCLLYFLVVAWKESFSLPPLVNTVLDVLNVIFLFCAAVATAAELGVHSCSNAGYTASNHITNGSSDRSGRCREAQAATAFLWFAWALWTVSLFFSFLDFRSSGSSIGRLGKGTQTRSVV